MKTLLLVLACSCSFLLQAETKISIAKEQLALVALSPMVDHLEKAKDSMAQAGNALAGLAQMQGPKDFEGIINARVFAAAELAKASVHLDSGSFPHDLAFWADFDFRKYMGESMIQQFDADAEDLSKSIQQMLPKLAAPLKPQEIEMMLVKLNIMIGATNVLYSNYLQKDLAARVLIENSYKNKK